MIKLQDFAHRQGVSDRQIQRLLKKYESDLVGHFERKGHNGTWLDDEACDLLRSKLKIKSIAVTDQETLNKIKQLEADKETLVFEKKVLEERIDKKDIIIERLRDREEAKDDRIKELENKTLLLEEDTQNRIDEAVKAAEDKLKLELETKYKAELKTYKDHYDGELNAVPGKIEEAKKQAAEETEQSYKKVFGFLYIKK